MNAPDDTAELELVTLTMKLATDKHREAMALITTQGTDPAKVAEARRLMADALLMAEDAAADIGTDLLDSAVSQLREQIAILDNASASLALRHAAQPSPWSTPWPWLSLVALAVIIAGLVA